MPNRRIEPRDLTPMRARQRRDRHIFTVRRQHPHPLVITLATLVTTLVTALVTSPGSARP